MDRPEKGIRPPPEFLRTDPGASLAYAPPSDIVSCGRSFASSLCADLDRLGKTRALGGKNTKHGDKRVLRQWGHLDHPA
jgi:hypothetical protein